MEGPIWAANVAWADYHKSQRSLINTVYESFGALSALKRGFRVFAEDAELVAITGRAQAEADDGYATFHAQSLVGLLGALEAYIEDYFKGTLATNIELLQGTAFDKIKLPASSFGLPINQQIEIILAETIKAQSSNLKNGISKYETLLKVVDRDGIVPRRVQDCLFEAQKVRNVWAHKAGRDRKSVV